MNEPFPTSSPAIPATLRRAAAEDARAIEGLYFELVEDAHIRVLPSQVAALAASETSFLLVADCDGHVCGTALLTVCPDVMYGTQPFGVVENVIVTSTKRGSGIGARLMAQLEQLALAHDCTKLMLLSSTAREAAHAFFRHRGFLSDTKHAFVKYRSQFISVIP